MSDERKFALITGASGGLGTVFCQTLSSAGWTIFACDLKAPSYQDPSVIPIFMDITDIASIEQARSKVMSFTQQLDLICDNAGMQQLDSLVEADPASLAKIVEVNLTGLMLVNRIFFDLLLKTKGRIIITSSEIGYHQAQPFHGLYSITKRAVDSYADSLRRELHCLGMKVIKLQPGGFKTAIINSSRQSYDHLLNNTRYYKRPLERMRPFVMRNLEKAKDPSTIRKAFMHAATSPHPKTRYRVNNMFILKILDLLGERGTDLAFNIFLGKSTFKQP